MRTPFARVRRVGALTLAIVIVVAATFTTPSSAAPGVLDPDAPRYIPGTQPLDLEKLGTEELVLQRDIAFITRRTAGDTNLTGEDAGRYRAGAAQQAENVRGQGQNDQQGDNRPGPITFSAAWTGLGPNPIVQVTRTGGPFAAMAGRIGALAIRKNGQFILGAAQGGIWLYDATTGTWSPKTDNLPSLSIGALAVAPSNDAIVYAGTGEGALSGDSYFGNGILKSTDGGATWSQVSGDYFQAVSISRLVVDPTDANHLYVAVLRGRGGARRVTPSDHSRLGIWESKNGAQTWKLLKEVTEANGATDLRMDPQNRNVLFASFWGDRIYKSTNGGASWTPIMNGLPTGANYSALPTRFALGISHPAAGSLVLYTGFDWVDSAGTKHPARVFRSNDGGANWTMLPKGSGSGTVEDYCGGQCWYDNVIEADPLNPDIVYAAGQFNYPIGSGGIYRSTDGGQTWKDLGWEQHPDFHAFAFNPNDPAQILIGNDGGVWYSTDRGGRTAAGSPRSAVTWQNLNGTVDKATPTVLARSNLQIAQFTSIATVPTVPAGAQSERFWGGTQDNGTPRKSVNSQTWFDVASGDGGQVLVDPTDANYVYGTYFGISPYRFDEGGFTFFGNSSITGGINLGDRSDFYVPFVMNKSNPNQLFLGTYRLYRTDNAKAASAGDVHWTLISPDLTSGCAGTAPNGARNCTISAIGVGGGQAVYTGSLDGLVYVSTDAQTNANPTWTRVGRNRLPNRPVTQFAVDRSNYRIAYASYAGFNGATPSRPGHIFKTADGGASWQDISSNLPDSPVNSVILDPSYPDTLYVGTDVGPFVSYNGGGRWRPLGSGFPVVAIWQLDMDPSHRIMAAGTHGRGAFRIADGSTPVPAFVLSKVDAGKPVGPGSDINYTLTLSNIGNAAATGVRLTDPIPANTTFVSADQGGTLTRRDDGDNQGENGRAVVWSGKTIAAGGTLTVHFTVRIDSTLRSSVKSIVNDGMTVTSAQGISTTGSPFITPIAPPNAVGITPASQLDGGRVGTSVPYTITVTNLGYKSDSYTMSATGAWSTSFFAADCSTPLTTTGTLAPGDSKTVCVKVAVPATAANDARNTTTVKATSTSVPSVSATATLTTIAVAVDTLLVDEDGGGPNVETIYQTALGTAGIQFNNWDLGADTHLPLNYLKAHKNVVWFTGNSYPGPLLPYEAKLQAYLDSGGKLLLSGQDILDQSAGTTDFVKNYLHVDWDGTEAQNDIGTASVRGVSGTLTNGITSVPLNHAVLGAAFEDQITPNGGATGVFTDDATKTDALSFRSATAPYRVVFLAFPLEAYGTNAQKADFLTRAVGFFNAP
ncbi:MAG: hypothetical protein M3T56_03330 [Chloroflexota bacterium]|nr:hypothetical protein [Chloroflexota bacterium]